MSIRDNFTEAEQEMIVASAMERTGLSRDEAERLLDARARPAKRNPFLERQWVRDLYKLSVTLATGRPKPAGLFARAFWIDLYGVLTELREKFSHAPEMCEALRTIENRRSYADALEAVYNASEALREVLADEEIVFITFMRQIHAHVYQDGFEYSVQKANPTKNQPGTIRDSQMIPLLHRHVSVDEAHRILDDIHRENGQDEIQLAVCYARKLQPSISQLESAMDLLEEERTKDRIASEQWNARRSSRGE